MRKSCLLVAFMLVLTIRSSLSMTRCKTDEFEALLKFKHSFTRDPQHLLSSWVGHDCCDWRGVSCDDVTSDVIKLNLRNSQGYNYDHPNCLVSSELSSALLELKFLTHLDLSFNDFNKSRIPEFMGSMTNLRYLNISNAFFSGPVPPQIGNLTNLIHLDLNNDYENSNIYTEARIEWASGLSKLQSLDMSYIDMSKSYDSLQVLFRLPSLLALTLCGCSLNNTHLSELGVTNISSLKHLDLSSNNLEGRIPSFLKNMPFLESLSFEFNIFSGDVPLWLSNMTHLRYLDLSQMIGQNTLNGSLPSELGQLTNLNYLDLSWNDLHGAVPTTFANLSALGHLDLLHNRLSGMIPDVLDVLGQLTELEYLDISSNSIQGTISHIGNLSKLSVLNTNLNNNIKFNLSTNWRPSFQLQSFNARSCGMNMVFPQWLRNQTQVTDLDLSNTGISGEFPQWLWNFTNLEYLLLAGNNLTGTLPRHITCDGCKLDWMDLQNNMLSGTIPHWLKRLKTIEVLDLSQNFFSGRIFQSQNGSSLLSGQNLLLLLDVSDNKFDGEIQVKNAHPLSFITILRLGWNDFSGLISSQLCQYTELAILDLAHNHLTGHIPRCLGYVSFSAGGGYSSNTGIELLEIIKGTTQKFAGTLGLHSMIDLSCNLLVGTIPEELANITNLMQLNLSNNYLTGNIPDDIGNLWLLESLDLSNNNLSGTIPQSLSDIQWLSFLNLSYNHLHGSIPNGRQLQTFADPSIYAGNSGLCGFSLLNTCSKPNPPLSPSNDDHGGVKDDDGKDKLDKLWLYLAVMSGVATGFWGVVLTLVFNMSWRHAYFRFVENIADRIYVSFKVRMNTFKRARTEKSG